MNFHRDLQFANDRSQKCAFSRVAFDAVHLRVVILSYHYAYNDSREARAGSKV
jgi:hypothetical protein